MLENELRDGAIPHAVRSRILTDHNLHIKPKTIQNIKQKELGNKKINKILISINSFKYL